jgi:hypothetical protein
MADQTADLVYELFCDDVRLEVGNKLSLMGVFQEIYVQQLPAVLNRFAIVTHWRGEGEYAMQVRILAPNRSEVASSQPARFQIPKDGYANNVTFFLNLQLTQDGAYTIQTILNDKVLDEATMFVGIVNQQQGAVN